MGMGDELMVTGQVRAMYARDPRPVAVLDRDGRVRKHPLWQGNDKIIDPRFTGAAVPRGAQVLRNGPGMRPYIADKSAERWTWRAFECTPGEIVFTKAERVFGAQYGGRIIVEPNLKHKASPNKDWGWRRWNELAYLMQGAGLKVTQLGDENTALLEGAELIHTSDFRQACAVLAQARACVLPEGGLHHAAAALGVRAVVIFGGYIAPEHTGYALHTNLFTGGTACGSRLRCDHCEAAMAAITPRAVFTELEKILVN